jgi:hypothetical protein
MLCDPSSSHPEIQGGLAMVLVQPEMRLPSRARPESGDRLPLSTLTSPRLGDWQGPEADLCPTVLSEVGPTGDNYMSSISI